MAYHEFAAHRLQDETGAKMNRMLTIIKELALGVSLLTLCVASFYLAKKYSFSSNIAMTQHLTDTTQSLLEKISDPIDVVLFSTDIEHYHQAEFLLAKYQRIKKNVLLHWQVEPFPHSNDYHGPALKINLGQQHEVIDLLQTSMNELSLSQALFKLRNKANQWVVFLQGHNEPSPFENRSTDYGLLRIALKNQGLNVQTLSLTKTPFIADNTRLLVIASPKMRLLPEEEKCIAEYLFKGGSVLWLLDKDSYPQPLLSDLFHVKALPGTIVDSHGHQLGTPHPAIAIIDSYPSLPFTTPKALTAFPFSVALNSQPNSDWETQSILLTHERSWTETGSLNGAIAFEPEHQEVSGPLVLGVTLTKKHPLNAQIAQRIAIIGNSRFLSNGVIENYGNLAFGLNLIHWLGHDDALITLSQPTNTDELLQLHLFSALTIQYGFPFFVLFIAVVGLITYIRRLRCMYN